MVAPLIGRTDTQGGDVTKSRFTEMTCAAKSHRNNDPEEISHVTV